MNKPRIGLLPLYAELYDRALPHRRPEVEEFLGKISRALENRGLHIITAAISRLRNEFEAAVRSFEQGGADAVVTLHLTYSPSLESADALASIRLPIIVLDTTPAYDFGPTQDPAQIFCNHGIHGVQDLCNLLIRKGKRFALEAGHWENSDVLDRVAGQAKAASMAARMQSARVGRIGRPFQGMGDFAIPPDKIRAAIGIEVVECDAAEIRGLIPSDDDTEVDAEIAADNAAFECDGLDPVSHRRTVRACLAVRRWLRERNLSAFTMNFLEIDKSSGLPVVPFLEASKAMARGTGYAGEGDVLTAALVFALASNHPDTSFTEMFCPDWAGNSIFLSHMGEMNLRLAAEKPRLRERPFPWTDADNPVTALARFRGGKAVLVNLAPGPEDEYTLIVAPVRMLDTEGEDKLADTIHGWFQPGMPISEFLRAYSLVGGTHHSALVYGDVCSDVVRFGEMMGWKVVVIGDGEG